MALMDERLRTRRSGSSNWKGLKKGHEVFRKGLRWVVNNGHEVSFWRSEERRVGKECQ